MTALMDKNHCAEAQNRQEYIPEHRKIVTDKIDYSCQGDDQQH